VAVLAAKVMESISSKPYELESRADRPRDAVRPGPLPHRRGADRGSARRAAVRPAADKAALAFHHRAAVSWAPTYALFRRRASLGPVTAGCRLGPAGTPPLIMLAQKPNIRPVRRALSTWLDPLLLSATGALGAAVAVSRSG
jgi:hypothetical protein